jgi:ATP-dependent exoDNAse (exonuclease V) alpha subunit
MIPKIKVVSAADGDMSFKLIRLQYPIRLAFSMTINKSQDQSLKYVGVNIREEVFSHGQLYVALSRATSGDRVTVLASDTATGCAALCKNVVFKEIFEG